MSIEKFSKSTDVTKVNPFDVIYLKGNESTDNSVRMIIETGEALSESQVRLSGVWNATSLRFSSSSVEIGRDLKIEAAADFIKTNNPSGFDLHSTALVPHIPFSATGTDSPHTPVVDVKANNVIFSTAVSEKAGTTISQAFTVTSPQIISTISYEVGTVGATAEVRHTIYKGTDNTGDIISRMNLPASKLPANTTTTIDFGSAFGFSQMQTNIFIEFTTDTSFTLKTDVGNNVLITLNSQQLQTRDLMYEDLALSNELDLTFSNELELTYSNQF